MFVSAGIIYWLIIKISQHFIRSSGVQLYILNYQDNYSKSYQDYDDRFMFIII